MVLKIADYIFLISLYLATFYLLAPLEFWTWNSVLLQAEKVFVGSIIICSLFGYVLVRKLIIPSMIQLTIVDGLLITYCLFLFLHGSLVMPEQPEPIFFIENFLLITIYICFRNMGSKKLLYLFWIILYSSLCQILFGIQHQSHWFAPGFGLSDIKGAFINQGPFAGLMAIAVLIIVGFFKNLLKTKRSKASKLFDVILYLILFLGFLLVLIYSNSRAAWLGCLVGCFLLIYRAVIGNFVSKCLISHLKKGIFYISLLVISLGLIFTLYNYKKDSADGRILIWKITAEMISDKPILGHGINSFQSNYMHYQADYLYQHPTDSNRHLAGNNIYAFNELLRLITEQGLLGLLMFFSLLAIYFRSVKKCKRSLSLNYMELISQSGLILIFVFGLFSYPHEILELKLIAILFLAALSNSSRNNISVPTLNLLVEKKRQLGPIKIVKKAAILGLILIVVFFVGNKVYKTSQIYIHWNIAISELKKSNFEAYISFAENNYTTLKANGYFLGYYGKSLFENQEYLSAIAFFEQALLVIPSTAVCIDIGNCYEKIGDFEKAKNYWIRAANMVPAQFMPKYLIAKMYFENGQKERARKMASDLLTNQKVKVYSIEVHEILEELKKISE